MKLIITETISVILYPPNYRCDSHRQADHVDECIELILPEVPENNGEVVPDHDDLFKDSQVFIFHNGIGSHSNPQIHAGKKSGDYQYIQKDVLV
jgi:hypothetical protein